MIARDSDELTVEIRRRPDVETVLSFENATAFVDRREVEKTVANCALELVSVIIDQKDDRGMSFDQFDWQIGETLDVERIESSISSLYSDGSYSKVQYEILQDDDHNVLRVEPIDKPWGPTVVEAALRVSDDFDGDSNYLLSLQAVTNNVNEHGGKWINRLRLGIRTGLLSEFRQPVFSARRTFVSASAEYKGRNVTLTSPTGRSLWRDRRTLLALDIGRSISNSAELRLGYEYVRAETAPEFGELPMPTLR